MVVPNNNYILTSLLYPSSDLASGQGRDLDSAILHHYRVLIIDDDPDFISTTKMVLCHAGYDVASALGCLAGLRKISELKPDVILLELMMKETDGYETYEHLRKITQAPVIVVTSAENREHAARSLQAGMEDYLTKPVHDSELIARIHAIIKRTKKTEAEAVKVFSEVSLVIKNDTQEVYRHEKFIPLVPRQFKVLSILAQHAPSPVFYSALAEQIWGEDSKKKRDHLKNIIFSLRQKLEDDPTNPKLLINYRGLGYRLATQEEWLIT